LRKTYPAIFLVTTALWAVSKNVAQRRVYNYLRRPLPPRIPPRIPRAICRPIELLAARIALFTIEVATES